MTRIGRRGFTIWKVRTTLEVAVMVVGLLLGGRPGIGTAWFALSVGPIVQYFLRRLAHDR